MKKLLLSLSLLFFSNLLLFSQSGMTVSEFKVKLERYFNEEMIEDIFKKVPQSTRFTIWGWDVGDYSGDNNPDLAFSIKILGDGRKITYVYLFIDIDGYLELVYVEPFEYVELPLEIGISIRDNKCSITQKKKKDFWTIKSYSFENGVIYLVEEYDSQIFSGYGLEKKVNYKTNECSFKIESLSNYKMNYQSNFLFVPSYSRSKYAFKGYPIVTNVDKVDFVVKGSYYWKGENDASFQIKSSYDQSFLYFTINIVDDNFVPKDCEKCVGDKFVLWFDFQPFQNSLRRLFKQSGNQFLPRNKPDGGIFSIDINLGNLTDRQPYIEAVNSTEPLDNLQLKAVEKIKIFFTSQDGDYILKIRVPFSFFGYEGIPLDGDDPIFLGFNAVFIDVDNEFRPNEVTCITNSPFEENNPSSFGELILIPDFHRFSYAKNIYLDNLLRILEEFGF